ncbi:MAG: ABC transporter permease [Kangiellaceae bacterium]|nr:ABC transporter permease [Kangiellaceae bacterium]
MEFGPILKSLKRRKAFASLIILQVAITYTVMTISTLQTNATLSEWNLPSGFDHENVVAVSSQIFDESVQSKGLVQDDIEKLSQLPQVKSITTAEQMPFRAERVTELFLDTSDKAQAYQTNIFDFDINGLEVLGIKVLQGRKFYPSEIIAIDESSQERPSVVMISEQMAKAMFEEQSAIGRQIYLDQSASPVEVIGVYSGFMNGETLNGRGMSYRSVIRPQVAYINGNDPSYLIRVEPGLTEAFLEQIRSELYQAPGRFVQRVEFLTRTQKRMYDGRGSRALLMLFISFVLLIITGLGISGLISFLVAQQKKQVGTRRALGAKKWQVIRYYLLENTIVTGIGLILGVILALTLIIILSNNQASNFISLGWMIAVGVFVWLISLISALNPAFRASKVAPAIVTRGA